MDEFQDEETFKKLNEREVTAWLEVKFCRYFTQVFVQNRATMSQQFD